MAEWYSANLAQEVPKGKIEAAKSGRWQGGWIKYGYQVDDQGYYDREEKEAGALLTMFQKVDEGMKQRLLTTIGKGYVTEAEADVQFTATKSEREYWEQELTNLQALKDNDDAAIEAFMVQLKQLDKWFDYGFYPSPEGKKQILNALLKGFVLYRDGRIELRFKLPVNEKQVADSVLSLT